VLDTNDDLGAGLPDFSSTAAVLYRPKVGFGAASTGLNQLPCCPKATAAKANTKLTDKVVLLIDFIPHLFESPEILWRDHLSARVFVSTRGTKFFGSGGLGSRSVFFAFSLLMTIRSPRIYCRN
jgi:hypothetical protein